MMARLEVGFVSVTIIDYEIWVLLEVGFGKLHDFSDFSSKSMFIADLCTAMLDLSAMTYLFQFSHDMQSVENLLY